MALTRNDIVRVVFVLEFDPTAFVPTSESGTDCEGACCVTTSSAQLISVQQEEGRLIVEVQGVPDPMNPSTLLPIASDGECDNSNASSCFAQCAFHSGPQALPRSYDLQYAVDLYTTPAGEPLRDGGVRSFQWVGILIAVGSTSGSQGQDVTLPVRGSASIDQGEYDVIHRITYDGARVDVALVDGVPDCTLALDSPCLSLSSATVTNSVGTERRLEVDLEDCFLDQEMDLYSCRFAIASDAAAGDATMENEIVSVVGTQNPGAAASSGTIAISASGSAIVMRSETYDGDSPLGGDGCSPICLFERPDLPVTTLSTPAARMSCPDVTPARSASRLISHRRPQPSSYDAMVASLIGSSAP